MRNHQQSRESYTWNPDDHSYEPRYFAIMQGSKDVRSAYNSHFQDKLTSSQHAMPASHQQIAFSTSSLWNQPSRSRDGKQVSLTPYELDGGNFNTLESESVSMERTISGEQETPPTQGSPNEDDTTEFILVGETDFAAEEDSQQNMLQGVGGHGGIFPRPVASSSDPQRCIIDSTSQWQLFGNQITDNSSNLDSVPSSVRHDHDFHPWSEYNLQHDKGVADPSNVMLAPDPGPVFPEHHDRNGIYHVLIGEPREHLSDSTTTVASKAKYEPDGMWNHQKTSHLPGLRNCHCKGKDRAPDDADPLASLQQQRPRNKGGRQRGTRLKEAKKKKLKEVRKAGACWHCYFMRIECSEGSPCETCNGIALRAGFRTYTLGCDRLKLQDRSKFMVPTIFNLQLQKEEVLAFAKNSVVRVLNRRDQTWMSTMKLPLTIGFGRTIELESVEVEPLGSSLLRQVGIVTDPMTDLPKPVFLASVPLAPATWVRKQIQRDMDEWLENLMAESLDKWPAQCFPSPRQEWQKSIFILICQFFQVSTNSMGRRSLKEYTPPLQAFRRTIKLSLLIHMMGHMFYVPQDLESVMLPLMRRTFGPQPTGEYKIGSRLINKFMKMIILDMVPCLVKDVLTGLNQLLRTQGNGDWATVFSITFMALTIIGTIQVSLEDRAEIGVEHHDDHSYTQQDAAKDIRQMEENLSSVLSGLFHQKYKTTNTNPAQAFNPVSLGVIGPQRPLSEKYVGDNADLGRKIYDRTRRYNMIPELKHAAAEAEEKGTGPQPQLLPGGDKHVRRLLLSFMSRFFQNIA